DDINREHAADEGKWNIGEHQRQVPPVPKDNHQKEQDARSSYAGVQEQLTLGLLLRFGCAAKLSVDARREKNLRRHLLSRVCHEGCYVSPFRAAGDSLPPAGSFVQNGMAPA